MRQEAGLEVQMTNDLAPQPSELLVHVMHPLEGSGAFAWRQALEAHLLLSGMAKACLQVRLSCAAVEVGLPFRPGSLLRYLGSLGSRLSCTAAESGLPFCPELILPHGERSRPSAED